MTSTAKKIKKTLGRVDRVDFPDLHLEEIDVKIDTGAYGCSIHCDHIEEVEVEGQKHIRFQLLDPTHPNYNHRKFEFSQYKTKIVKSSSGVPEERFVIQTRVLLFNELHSINLSLTNRGEMKYPVLLGRTLLNGKFVVDTSRTNLSFKHKGEKHEKTRE